MVKKIKKSPIKNAFQTIILIGAVACIIYGLYTLFIKDDNKKIEEKINIQLKDVKVLYSYLNEAWPNSSFHENKELNVVTIDENDLFKQFIISENLHEKTFETESCTDYSVPCKIGSFKYEEVLNKLKSKYGSVKLTKDIYGYNLITCKKENDEFNCYITLGGVIEPVSNLSTIVNYIETDEKLDIYDKYIKYNTEEYSCYIDNSMTIECNNPETFENDVHSLNEEELINKYGGEYIHTYLKDKSGNYYWYSSKMNK